MFEGGVIFVLFQLVFIAVYKWKLCVPVAYILWGLLLLLLLFVVLWLWMVDEVLYK